MSVEIIVLLKDCKYDDEIVELSTVEQVAEL